MERFVLLFAVFQSIPALIRFHDWQCGHTDTTRNFSYTHAMTQCRPVAGEWNHCCVKHDECYVRQLGQEHCDDEFCHCMERANSKRNSSDTCRIYSDTACYLLPMFGTTAYNESSNYTEPLELMKHVPEDPTLPYHRLYEACPLVNATLSSCALMFNICPEGEDSCRNELCQCIQDAYRMDNLTSCDRETAFICELLDTPRLLDRLFLNLTRTGWYQWIQENCDVFFPGLLIAVIGLIVSFGFWWGRRSSHAVLKTSNITPFI